jgi:hypothetical protein
MKRSFGDMVGGQKAEEAAEVEPTLYGESYKQKKLEE